MDVDVQLKHLSGRVSVADHPNQLFDDVAGLWRDAAINAVEHRGVFHVALSGGSTPKPLYIRLATDPRHHSLPWSQTHVWMVDERRVPADDERSNLRMIRESLINHVPVHRQQLHPILVGKDDPAGEYEADILHVLGDRNDEDIPRLDFVLLGMGGDGHTASLFPHSPAIHERVHLIAANDGPTVPPPPRVTMTYPFLNAARQLAVLCTGQKKAAALRRVDAYLRDHGPDPPELPITGINPTKGLLTWFLDAEAADRTSSRCET